MQLLVVDDDEDNLEFYALWLALEGATVHGAASVDDARAWLASHTPTAVLTDLHMPSAADGRDFIRGIRETPRLATTPVVLVTGDASRTLSDDAKRFGVDAYVKKPVNAEALVAAVVALAAGR